MPNDFESERLATFFEAAHKVLFRCEELDAAFYFSQVACTLRAGIIKDLPVTEEEVAKLLGV